MPQHLVTFQNKPSIIAGAAVCGGLELQGPLADSFDLSDSESKFESETWEKAESEMVRLCVAAVRKKANCAVEDLDAVFSGDLTNQCTATALGLRGLNVPILGLYGACSTFAMSMGLAAAGVNAGYAGRAMALTSSHFCTAERQYRFPLEYGCQRTPTAQTTVTGCGSAILGPQDPSLPYVSEFLPGKIVDFGISDTSHMGAAMAPACADTLVTYFQETGMDPNAFDLILTGDLGFYGLEMLREICQNSGLELGTNLQDCGLMIYDRERQAVDAGGSGCGCSSSVFCGHILDRFNQGKIKDILLIGTGALLSATSVLQKETIPGIAHLIRVQKGA